MEPAPRGPAGHGVLRRHGSGQSWVTFLLDPAEKLSLLHIFMVLFPQVWDVLQEEALSNYRGHAGYLLSVDWSPVDPDVVWTGGKDFTAQEWRVSKQEFTKPPKGERTV